MAPVLTEDSLLTADAGYHSEANLTELAARDVDALIADGTMRTRDERFATQARHLRRSHQSHLRRSHCRTTRRPTHAITRRC